ncbi:MAG: adenosylmethionine--8-amino-7-oxononanoate transaminase [Polyangiaceae bacterium]|nr:adenosylmethionine--8-amino-7-oxononanoate transaminase [Polyangiaceae bacterium]
MTPRARIVAADRRHLWHPYTPIDDAERREPLVIARAEGIRLWDADGRSYLDANASWWAALLGHGHPRLVAALERQARALCHVALAGITHEPAALLAEELAAVAPPGLGRVFFSDDGSTAVEVAMKLALQYHAQTGAPERVRFLALDGAFHGDTLGATALGGVELFRRPFAGVLLDCLRVPYGDGAHERAFSALAALLERDGSEVAAVVLEPVVQGAAGMRVYDAALLAEARRLCDHYGALLVADEVFTGYGRTGPFWACEHSRTTPDLLCTAKGFTGGMLPMSATLVAERVYEAFRGGPERAFWYGHTYCGNPLGAAIAREVLAIYRDERVLDRARPKAARIARAFERLAGLPGVRATRSLGMVGAAELEGAGYLERSGWRVHDEARARGAYLRPLGNVVYVTPALNAPDADLDELLAIVEESIRAALR